MAYTKKFFEDSGKKGGLKTKAKLGVEHYRRIGQMKKKKKKV